MKARTQAHLAWVKGAVRFDHAAQEATLLDYIHEVDHVAARTKRLESEIDAAVNLAPPRLRAVIEALLALRWVALVTAVPIAAEVDELAVCPRHVRRAKRCRVGNRLQERRPRKTEPATSDWKAAS